MLARVLPRLLFIPLLCAPLVVFSQEVSGQPAAIGAERLVDFQIEPQGLAAALDRYSLATGVQIFYASNLAQGRESSRVSGRYSTQEALLILLQGTGLRPRITAADAITLERIDRPPSTAEATAAAPFKGVMSLRLDTLQVEARREAPAALRYGFYAAAVRAEVGKTLRRDARLRDRRYWIQLSIWLDPDGRVTRSLMHKSSGNSGIDVAVVAALGGMVMHPTPPPGMPQPIHIDINAMGA